MNIISLCSEVPFGDCQYSKIHVGDTDIKHLEHVDLRIDITTARRGDIGINLLSPSRTDSRMLELREHDAKQNIKFIFNTVLNWGENPHGDWWLTVCSSERRAENQKEPVVVEWGLTLYGIEEDNPNTNREQRDRPFGPSHRMTKGEVEEIMVRQEQEKKSYDCTHPAVAPTRVPPGYLEESHDWSAKELDEALGLLQDVAQELKSQEHQQPVRQNNDINDEQIYRAAAHLKRYLQG